MVQLPALNTTQFGWVLNKLPNKPRPMGKVYQPEVAATAKHFPGLGAAEVRADNLRLGRSTLVCLVPRCTAMIAAGVPGLGTTRRP